MLDTELRIDELVSTRTVLDAIGCFASGKGLVVVIE